MQGKQRESEFSFQSLANQVQAENQMSQSHTEAMYVAGICDGCQAREKA